MSEKKIKLLFILPAMGIGGAEVFCANLIYEFSQMDNFEVHLIVFSGEINAKFNYAIKGNVIIHMLHKKAGFSFSFLRLLKKTIKSINPDIINSHSSHTLRYLLLIRRIKKIPLIHTITNNPQIYNKYCHHLYKFRMHQKSWGKITFVGISNLISDTLSKVYSYPRNKIETIYNGIYQLQPQKANYQLKYDFFNCANLSEVKRQDLLIKSLSKMKNNATLCIAGDGPLKSELIALSQKLGVSKRVYFLGQVEDPTDLYFSSKCFILTSRSEGNPISINEAFSAGIPVIAPIVGGIPDLVENGINGYLFDKDATPEFVASLMDRMLMADSKTMSFFKKNNQEKVQQWYMPCIKEQYVDLIKRKLAK